MSDLIIKAKHIKFVGIALIVISLIDILSVIIRSIAYEVQFNWILILYVSPIIIGIAFFMTNKSMQDGIFASGMFLTAIMQVMYIISGVSYFTFYHLPMCITALFYAVIGIIAITRFKKVTPLGIIILLYLIAESLFSRTIIPAAIIYFFNKNRFYYHVASEYFFILNTLHLLCILVYMLMHAKKTKEVKIKLNSDVIDFKTLLSFIESEYKTGNITEDEYNRKRAEIISKI